MAHGDVSSIFQVLPERGVPLPSDRAGRREPERATGVVTYIGAAPGGSTILLESVSKTFDTRGGSVPAVSDVTLRIPAGSSLLLRGPTGCGKTTILSLIGCLVRPTSGRIRIGELETTRLHEDLLADLRRRRFGFVFQNANLVRGASALLNVMIPALPARRPTGELTARAAALLTELGLGREQSRRVELLSGGEQQRVALARALVNTPEVLIADEPTAHQDDFAKRSFFAIVERLLADGRTVIVASHDDFVTRSHVFSRTIELREGRIVG